MIMNTNTNRTLEHLNIFSIDYYKKQQQQQQQQYDEINMNIMSDQHDQTLQTNIKDEKKDYYVDNHLKTSPISTDKIDQPLLIVLDEDDINGDDENEQSNLIINETISKDDLSNNEEQNINNSSTVKQSLNTSKTSLKPVSNTLNDSKHFRRPRRPRLFPSLTDRNHQTSNKLIRTVVIDTNFMRQAHQQNRNKLIARRKTPHTFPSSHNMSNNNNSNPKNHSIDDSSIVLPSNDTTLSNISFDNISDILTVSRMGSIFYCLEDLYTKVFSSLCTLEEFTNLISKPGIVLIKQVTLSEKMSIDQQIPSLKKYNENRYRLVSINSSDYLLKLKHLLLTMGNLNEKEKQQHEKRLDQIIDEMRSYKRTPTPVLVKDKILHSPMTTKRLSSDDDEDEDDDLEHDEAPRKRLKIVAKKQKSNETPPLAPTQFGIFIQCNGPVSCNIFSTNETVSSTTTNTSTETTTTTVAKSESTIVKKSNENENTQIYFDKFQQQYQNLPKFNLNHEQSISKPTNLNRADSHSPVDCTQINKSCSSNMPIKRRILNSYNSDTSDSSGTTTVRISTPSINHSRYLYRSKSLTYINQQNKTHSRRSSSLPSLICHHIKENLSNKKILLRESNTKLNIKSKTEPIDLTDENYSMPMIVNVEENVELANQRQKIKSQKPTLTNKQKPAQTTPISDPPTRIPPSTVISRSTSHESNPPPPVLTKPTPIHHPIPSNSYCTSPYVNYHQEPYTYRESSQTIPSSQPSAMSHPYLHSATNPNNGNLYPYPYPSSSAQYSPIKKPKESLLSNSYDTRPNPTAPNHLSSSSLSSNNNNNNNNNNNGSLSSVVMPIVRKPNYYHQLTPEQQASIKMQASPPSSAPCRLPCCYPPSAVQQQHQQQQSQYSTDKSAPNERLIYRQYSTVPPQPQTFKRDPSQTPDIPNSSPSINRKQRRIDPMPPSTTPYPSYLPTKSYFAPPPPPSSSSSSNSSSASHWSSPSPSTLNPNMKPLLRYPYPPPPNTPMNGMARKIESYSQSRRPTPVQSRAPQPPPTSTQVVAQNSSALISPPNTPHELTLPNIRIRSIDLQRAIIERGYCDMDKLPKLVVRHTKTYSNKTIDTMGQLFPTWFNEPDYRCIHCFRCDQVFTPQQFMTHVDDEHMQTEQPLSMTSIQLLTSEKMSEYKVGLWNQFCTNLTVYAREGRIGGFSTNRNV